jgi:hypothetical protein
MAIATTNRTLSTILGNRVSTNFRRLDHHTILNYRPARRWSNLAILNENNLLPENLASKRVADKMGCSSALIAVQFSFQTFTAAFARYFG